MYPRELCPGAVAQRVGRSTFYRLLRDFYPRVEGRCYRDYLAAYPDHVADLKRGEMRRRHCEFIVVMRGDTPAAILAGEGVHEEAFHLRYVAVCQNDRRRGLARATVNHLAEHLALCHYRWITALHRPDNAASLLTAMACGFVLSGFEVQPVGGALVQTCRPLSPTDRQRSVGGLGQSPASGRGSPRGATWVEAGKTEALASQLLAGRTLEGVGLCRGRVWALLGPSSQAAR